MVRTRDAVCPRTSRAPEAAAPSSARCHAHAATPPANRSPRVVVCPRRSAPQAPARSAADARAPQNRHDRDRRVPVSAPAPDFLPRSRWSAHHAHQNRAPAMGEPTERRPPPVRSDAVTAADHAPRPASPNRRRQAARRARDARQARIPQHGTTVDTLCRQRRSRRLPAASGAHCAHCSSATSRLRIVMSLR